MKLSGKPFITPPFIGRDHIASSHHVVIGNLFLCIERMKSLCTRRLSLYVQHWNSIIWTKQENSLNLWIWEEKTNMANKQTNFVWSETHDVLAIEVLSSRPYQHKTGTQLSGNAWQMYWIRARTQNLTWR